MGSDQAIKISVGRILMYVSLASSLGCRHSPTLTERIKATGAKLNAFNTGTDDVFPKTCEREIVELANAPTDALADAFRSLDVERTTEQGGHPYNDGVWLTGTLITILAFDCRPISARDQQTWGPLKSRLAPPRELTELKQDVETNQMLAEWPWRNQMGAWHLDSFYIYRGGTSHGEIAPFFANYESHFRRRGLR